MLRAGPEGAPGDNDDGAAEMQVNSFTVEGYRNLTTPVTLGPLCPIGVMYAANNIGKPNLLRALDLFFGLLRVGNQVSKDQAVSMDRSEQISGHPFDQISPTPDPQP